MAVHIRLRRMGKKKQPFYRIVAADHRRARDGRFLEILGTYNPMTVPAKVTLFEEKVTKWLNDGAEPSETVSTLFTQIGFTEKYLKLKKGEDVSSIEIRTEITERRKKTKGMKKAVAAEAEAKKTKAEEAPAKAAAEESAPAEEAAPAEKAATTEETAPIEKAATAEEAAPVEKAATSEEAAPVEKAATAEEAAPPKVADSQKEDKE